MTSWSMQDLIGLIQMTPANAKPLAKLHTRLMEWKK